MTRSEAVGARPVEVRIREHGDVAIAVFQARNFASAMGADAWTCAEIATACSELASNIFKYAKQGRILIMHEIHDKRAAVLLKASDRGPGIANPEQALRESYSSSGTLGLGLPSVRRIMDTFSIHACDPQGCCIIARKYI